MNWNFLSYDRHNILVSFFGKSCDLLSLGSNDLSGFYKLRNQVFLYKGILDHNSFAPFCENLCTRVGFFLSWSSFLFFPFSFFFSSVFFYLFFLFKFSSGSDAEVERIIFLLTQVGVCFTCFIRIQI